MTFFDIKKKFGANRYLKWAFTLTETLTVLTILAVIIAIIAPGILKKNSEEKNKIKLQKAILTYKSALNRMVFENNLISDEQLTNFGGNSCSDTSKYFNVSRSIENYCVFMTNDGVYWNITDIKKPLVAFNRNNLNNNDALADNNSAFYLFGKIKDNRTISINEFDDELSEEEKQALAKVYTFLVAGFDIASINLNEGPNAPVDPCANNINCRYARGDYDTACTNNLTSCTQCISGTCKTYVENGDVVATKLNCNEEYDFCRQIDEFNFVGNTIKQTYYNADGSFNYYFERIFDETGTLKKQTRYDCNYEDICAKEEFFGDDGSTLVRRITYNKSTGYKTSDISFNAQGTTTRKISYNGNTGDITGDISYNDKGKETIKKHYKNGVFTQATYTSYAENETTVTQTKNRCITETMCGRVDDYENGQPVHQTFYKSDGVTVKGEASTPCSVSNGVTKCTCTSGSCSIDSTFNK